MYLGMTAKGRFFSAEANECIYLDAHNTVPIRNCDNMIEVTTSTDPYYSQREIVFVFILLRHSETSMMPVMIIDVNCTTIFF